MLAAGIPTGLGSDSVASNNRMDMLTEARVATWFQSVRLLRPDALSATAALRLATLGGAEALGLNASIGSLEVGKEADFAVFPLDRIEALAGFNPVDTLVHALAGAVSATTVVVAGVERVTRGAIVSGDPLLASRFSALGARLREWRAAAQAR
jgi:cytosine/adenosine deaminase-related metal-dependent hydrolase